jgi:hypothetical protein
MTVVELFKTIGNASTFDAQVMYDRLSDDALMAAFGFDDGDKNTIEDAKSWCKLVAHMNGKIIMENA